MSIYNFNSVFHQVDLSLLKHFFAIATFGGFSKASRATGVSQPALSLGLQRLEKSLGLELVKRSSREFQLTNGGQTLLTFCQRFEGNFESIMSTLGVPGVSPQRRLRVGTALSIGFAPLDHLCEAAEAHTDRIELDLLTQNTYELLAEVFDGTIDGAFVPDDVYDSRLKLIPLVRDRIAFVIGAKYQSVFAKKSWREALKTLPLLTYPRETPMRALTDRICVGGKLEFKTIYSINNTEALKQLVVQNRGGAFVLRTLVAAELQAGLLFEENLDLTLPKSGISLAIRRDEMDSANSRLLTTLFKDIKEKYLQQ